jgi:hypothetical protein
MVRLLYMRVGGNPCYGITCDTKVNAGCIQIVRTGSLAPLLEAVFIAACYEHTVWSMGVLTAVTVKSTV